MRFRTTQRGFTLVELLVSLLVLSAVIIGILALFDSTNRLASSQLSRVDLQQSLRVGQREIGRMIRLAGRGGLAASSAASQLPQGLALSHVNNVPASYDVLDNGSSPPVVEGSDVLTVRGVFNTPVYLVEYANPATFTIDPGNFTGTVTIRNVTPIGNVPQELDPLEEMLGDGNRPEALVLVSPFSEEVFGVAEIDYAASTVLGDAVVLGFRYSGGTHATAYATLSSGGAFPAAIFSTSRVGTVGILEEYRFYLRRDDLSDLGASLLTDEVARLSRARTYPGVAAAYDDDLLNLQVDIAENVIDFQVAFAFDGDGNGEIAEAPGGADDEWLLNSSGDDPTAAPWDTLLLGSAPSLRFVRLTTLARSAQIDREHMSPELSRLEDHYFTASDPLNDPLVERRYQRIVLRTTVDIRNL